MVVWSSSKEGYLCGLQAVYTSLADPSQKLTSACIKSAALNTTAITLQLAKDEQIIQIKGNLSIGNVVRIYVLTNHGRYVESGSKIGEEFCWRFKPEQHLCGFKVCAGDYVTYLFALYDEREPQVYEKDIKKICYPNTYVPCTFLSDQIAIINKREERGTGRTSGIAFDDFFDNDFQLAADSIRISQVLCTAPYHNSHIHCHADKGHCSVLRDGREATHGSAQCLCC
eukprot:TRINITY_DN4699_c0_g2_i2.p1 TRINITY_DN4699_c0_g2~~TRINITY_DN4699_c0_g2_i2.p1  ORF type:complete len:227 (+),score=14.13 TRINITY_DN4699_c0_g2_i2:152-832(+)